MKVWTYLSKKKGTGHCIWIKLYLCYILVNYTDTCDFHSDCDDDSLLLHENSVTKIQQIRKALEAQIVLVDQVSLLLETTHLILIIHNSQTYVQFKAFICSQLIY